MKRLARILAMLCCIMLCSLVKAEEPLRAVIFYQEQTWLQEFNIMHQIADKTQSALEGHPEVALSCYGVASMDVVQSIQAAIDMQADVLLCNGVNSEKCLAAYAQLHEAGVRLILVDGDAPEAGRLAYIGTDNAQSGAWALNWIADRCGQAARIAVLMPALNTSLCSVGARAAQFEKSAAEKGAMIVTKCETSYDSLEAIRRIGAMLDEHPEINVLYCTDAVSGKAAATLVQERALCDKITVITYDRFEQIDTYLESGAVDVTLTQNTEAVGTVCAEMLIRMANGEDIEDLDFECIPVYRKEAMP